MHILQILHDCERGGIVTLASMIEEGLAAHGITVETAYLFPGPGLSSLAKLSCAGRMARRIFRGGFDALIAYQPTASILVGAIGRLQGCPLRIVHQTSAPWATSHPVRLVDKIVGALGLYSVNVANSFATRAEFAGYPDRYQRSMKLIEHGFDLTAPKLSREEARGQFQLPVDAPVVLNVGRLVPQKNQDVLIRAMAMIPGVHLALAGDGLNGPIYRVLAHDLKVTDRVHFLGARSSDDIANLYRASDLFVFPSIWETFGLAAVEAAMAGLPMVVADLPVLREVLSVDAQRPVSFVHPHDVEGWTQAICASLDERPSRRALDGFSSAISRKYSRERMIQNYLDVLNAWRPAVA
jgi:glycosyltransferase involved in cell wall biosynthesis